MVKMNQKLANIHAEALKEFDDIQSALKDEREQCLKERRFYSIPGAMWEGALGEQFANKPKYEVNKVHLAVIRIINEYRNNRITVDFVPKDGVKDDKLADMCDGLYRSDEQDSCAEEAYDNAFEEAVGGGIGGYRFRAEYEDESDEENEYQRIKIEPIYDADSSIYFDLGAKRQDKSDAKRCYVITSMARKAYEEEYGDDPASWEKTVSADEFDWCTPDVVYICELYRIEEIKKKVQIWEMLDGTEKRYSEDDFEDDPKLLNTLEAIGSKFLRERVIKKRKCHKYTMNGNKILSDDGFIAGTEIPIVPEYGKRWYVDNVERCMGHTRLSMDVSRLKNMQYSKLAEISAFSSIEKPIFTPEQMSGHSLMWEEDNIKDYPYLLINMITDINGNPMPAGPVDYTRAPQIPPALAALLQVTEEDMKDLLGNQEAGEEMQSNISGVAVELIQQKLDMQTYIYMSNAAKARKRGGEIWLSMAKDVYVEEGRSMKTVGRQGEIGRVELLKPIMGESGEVKTENDLANAKFDVAVEVGPSSSSRRNATVKALAGMASITEDPETKQVLGAAAMMNMEGEGLSGVRKYFRNKLVRMGVEEPTEEEIQQMKDEQANQPPDPNAEYLAAAAEQAKAEANSANADTVLKIAKAQESEAKAFETASKIDAEEQRMAIEVLDKINGTDQPKIEKP